MHDVLALAPRRPQANRAYALTWIGSVWSHPEAGFADGITKLCGAHAVILDAGRATRRRYWHPTYRPPLTETPPVLSAMLRDELGRVIRRRVPDEGTPGVILSGGFDSSAVAGTLATEAPDRVVRNYSAVFPGDEIDESDRVNALVAARGMHSTQMYVHPTGVIRRAAEFQRAWGIPVAGPGYVLERVLLERAAQDGVSGVFDGQGGDEVFGFSPYLAGDRIRRGRALAALRLLRSFPDQDAPPRHVVRYLARLYGAHGALPYGLQRRIRSRGDRARHLPRWIRRELADEFFEAYDPYAWKRTEDGPLWWSYLTDMLTTARDRSGHSEYIGTRGRDLGLSMRLPLLDPDLAEFVVRLPPELGFGGMNRWLARDSVRGDVPDEVRLAPTKSNLRSYYHGALAGPDLPAIRRLLADRDARVREYADPQAVDELIERPPAIGERGWGAWSAPIWRMATAEIALRSLEDPRFPDAFLASEDVAATAVDDVSPVPAD
jgi:asparagine synthase (glutamine-hydrolysing)